MNLREQAAIDARTFLEDAADGFGRAVTVTDPDGNTVSLTGYTNDIAQTIDPETGVLVSARVASVALPIIALTEAGLGIPVNVPERARKPWVVQFDDVQGDEHTFKVSEAVPDRAIGVVVCMLEPYKQ